MWDLSALARIEPRSPSVKVQSPDRWTAREALFFNFSIQDLETKAKGPQG